MSLLNKENIIICIMAAAGTLLPGQLLAAPGDAYYVSGQSGNDSWSGLLAAPNSSFTDGPLQSLSRAQAKMRTTSVKTVNVRAGTYSISSPLQFSSADNGEQWIAYPGESPVFDGGYSGGINVTNSSNLGLTGFT